MRSKYLRASRLVDLASLQEVVDLIIGNAISIFVWAKRNQVLEIRRRHLGNETRRSTQIRRQGSNSAFVESEQRKDVGGTVTELREKAHQCLGRMVGADDQATVGSGKRELSDHALTSLDVAEQEILASRVTEICTGSLDRIQHSVGGRLDVDTVHFVGADRVQGPLGITLVCLDSVWQPNGQEFGLISRRSQFFDCASSKKGSS